MVGRVEKLPPGRPPSVDVDLETYGYVRGELAKGRALSEIVRHGYTVYAQMTSGELVKLSQLKGNHFEAKYRAIEERCRPPYLKHVGGRFHRTPNFCNGMSSIEAMGATPPRRHAGRRKIFEPVNFRGLKVEFS